MKALKISKKNIIFISALIAAITAIGVMGSVYAGTINDKRNGDDDSIMFSPGYLNAAKQQSQIILNQETGQKNLWQRAVEYVQKKLSQQAEEMAQDDVKPELQQRSSSETAAVSTTTTTTVDAETVTTTIEAAVASTEQAAQDVERAEKLMNEAMNKGASVTTLSNGNIVNLWKESGNFYLNIKDSNDNIIRDTMAISGPSGSDYFYVNAVTDLGDGRFVLNTNSGNYNNNSSGNYYSYDGRYVQSLTTYGAAGDLEYSKDYVSTYSYSYNNNTNAYTYDSDYTWLSNVTAFGDGTFAAVFDSYSYHYDNSNSTYTYSYSDQNTIRVLSASLDTLNQYTFNTQAYDPTTGTYNYTWVNSLASTGDGRFVVSTSEYGYDGNSYTDGTRFTLMDKNDLDSSRSLDDYANTFVANSWGYNELTSTYTNDYQYVTKMISAGDDRIAVGWTTYDSTWNSQTGEYQYNDSLQVQYIDLETADDGSYYLDSSSPAENLGSAYDYTYDGNTYTYNYNYISEMKALDDGSVVIAISGGNGYYDYKTGQSTWGTSAELKVLSADGSLQDMEIGTLADVINMSITNVTDMGGGTFGFVLTEEGYTAEGLYVNTKSAEQFSSAGIDVSSLYALASEDKGDEISEAYDALTDNMNKYDTVSAVNDLANTGSAKGEASIADETKLNDSAISMENLSLKESTMDSAYDLTAALSGEELLVLMGDSLADPGALSAYNLFGEGMDYASTMAALSSIIKNPTEDQKKIIDTISALIADIEKVKEEAGNKGLFKEEEDALIKAATAALLAQALPDLLTSQDITNIKGIFSALSFEKGSILKQYEDMTKPYYDELVKDIAKNLEALQMTNILSKKLTKDQLDKIPRSDIDKIIEKLKKQEKKTFAEDYILQQEQKYRKSYIDPNKKVLEERMGKLLKNFTEKLNKSLERSPAKKK